MSGPGDQAQKNKPAAAQDVAPQPAGPAATSGDTSKPMNGGDVTPKNADPSKPGVSSTVLTVSARYENIPGASKDGPKAANAKSALWLDPLTFAPMSPHADETTNRIGVSKGASQTVAKFNTPLHTEGEEPGAGTGGLTAQLQYASNIKDSFDVKVDVKLPKGVKASTVQSELHAWLAERMDHTGDLEKLNKEAADHVTQTHPDASDVSVKITPVTKGPHALVDAGKSHIFYKARANPVIDLNVPVVNVAEKTITSGAKKTKVEGEEQVDETHHDSEQEKVKIKDKKDEQSSSSSTATQTSSEEYHRAKQRTYDAIVSELETKVQTLASELVKKVDSDSEYHNNGKWEENVQNLKVEDYTKNVKAGTESGEKDKKNAAAWIEDGLKAINKVINLPLEKISPKYGKYLRRLNEWGWILEGGEDIAKGFAVRGKVHYTDSHEDTTVKKTTDDKTTKSGSNDQTITRHDTATLTEDLKKVFTSATSKLKTTHITDSTTEDITKKTKAEQKNDSKSQKTSGEDYQYDKDKNQQGGSSVKKKNQGVKTELEYTATVKETTTKPILEANIVDGDGEVAASPFPAPGAKKEPPKKL